MSLIARQTANMVRAGDHGLLERLEEAPPHRISLEGRLALIDRAADFIEKDPVLNDRLPDEAYEAFTALDTLRTALSRTIWNNDQGLTQALEAESAMRACHDRRRCA